MPDTLDCFTLWFTMRVVDRKRVGARLRRLRTEKGLTPTNVAAAIGCDRTGIHHVEAGRYGLTVALVLDLARLYGTTAEDLVHGKGA